MYHLEVKQVTFYRRLIWRLCLLTYICPSRTLRNAYNFVSFMLICIMTSDCIPTFFIRHALSISFKSARHSTKHSLFNPSYFFMTFFKNCVCFSCLYMHTKSFFFHQRNVHKFGKAVKSKVKLYKMLKQSLPSF